MELTLWTYEGPPTWGPMRIARFDGRPAATCSHAPQGDTTPTCFCSTMIGGVMRPPVT